MSAKLIKIRTIIDFILLNSNLSHEQFAKRLNKLISTHNRQVSQGMLAEDIVEQMTRIFATSGLYRPEKDASYYEHTAIKAAKDTPHYTPPKASSSASKAASGGNSK